MPKRTLLLYGLTAIACIVPLWSSAYLPFTDLPQHAAQLTVFTRFSDASLPFQQWFQLNFFTPYSAFFFVARMFSTVFDPITSIRIVLSIIVIAFPVSFYALLSETDGPLSWTVAGFPLAYGANMMWGHFSFLFAVPVGILFWAATLKCQKNPGWKNAATVALISIALFFSHLMVLVYCVAIGIIIMAARAGARRETFIYCVSILPALLIAAIWISTRTDSSHKIFPFLWQVGWHRIFELPHFVIGLRQDLVLNSVLVFVLVCLLSFEKHVSREWWRWAPFILTLAIRLVGPFAFYHGPVYIAQRFSVFLIPSFLFTLNRIPGAPAFGRIGSQIALTAVTVALGVILTVRFRGFDKEAASFPPILQEMKPERKLVYFDRNIHSAPYFDVPTIHFGAYYQIHKAGLFENSFANFSQSPVRYRPGASVPRIKYGHSWDKTDMTGGYDYYLIHSIENEADRLKDRPSIRLKAQNGPWWLFESTLTPSAQKIQSH